MSEGRSGPVRVRIAGQEIPFPDLDAVRRLVDEGQIGASAEIRLPGSERWEPLARALAARPVRKDPWAVWEEAESVDPVALWPEPPAPAPPPPPARPVEEPQELPVAALTPVEEEPSAESPRSGPKFVIDASKRGPGKVIAFPTARSQARPSARPDPESTGPLALASDEPVPLRPPPPPPRPARLSPPPPEPPQPAVRWGRVLGLLGLGAAALLLARWYVVGTATESFPRPPESPAVSAPSGMVPATTTPPEAPAAPAPSASIEAPYADVEEKLRGLLQSDVLEVTTEEAIEDAMLIELRAVRLDVIRVDAVVQGWTGRKRDQPKVMDLRIDLRSQREQIDWDLGGVGLVVGKYVQRFGWELPHLDVVFEGVADTPQKMTLDHESSRQLYLSRMTLLEYLRTRPGR